MVKGKLLSLVSNNPQQVEKLMKILINFVKQQITNNV